MTKERKKSREFIDETQVHMMQAEHALGYHSPNGETQKNRSIL